MSQKARVSFHTLGCRLNQSETSTIAKSFREKGYEVVPFEESADVCVINTCTVTGHSDAKNRQVIRSAHRRNPKASIAVVGCYSQMAAQEITALDGVKLVMGNAEKLRLVDYVEQSRHTEEPLVINPKISRAAFAEPVFQWEQLTTRAHLKIQDGCDFMCSFCIIPFSRGRSRNRLLNNLLEDAQAFVNSGSQEIVLTGVNIGTYQDRDRTIVDVVDALNAINGVKRIRISSIEPTTVPPGLIDRMADADHKLVPFLHLPLQSGSDSILSQMKRRYTRDDYWNEVMRAADRIPDLCLGTDVMVGFPGETDEQFDDTFQVLNTLPFAYFHVFPFSERKGTPAARMANKVSVEEKQRRGTLLRQLSLQKRNGFYQRFVGTVRPVLFETPKPSGEITGYTDNYIKVALMQPNETPLKNQIRPVYLKEGQTDRIFGELI